MNMISLKIARAKWYSKEYLQEDDIGADAITSLRTSGDTLSMWRCNADKETIQEVALALVSNGDNFDTINIVFIPCVEIECLDIEMQNTPGVTPHKSISDRHVDLVHLNIARLTYISQALAPRIRSENNSVYTFTARALKTLVLEAIKSKKIDINTINSRLLLKIEKVATSL